MNKEYHETSKKHKKWKIHLSLLPSMFQFRSIDELFYSSNQQGSKRRAKNLKKMNQLRHKSLMKHDRRHQISF